MVVTDGDRVVSTATLLRESVTISGVAVPTGQVEMVATDPAYEGRGLVRALMDEAHRRSADRGDLLQVMIGIPFFYRQFGYSYAMPIPMPWDVHDRSRRRSRTSPCGRRAATDIPAMEALQTERADAPLTSGCPTPPGAGGGSCSALGRPNSSPSTTARSSPPLAGHRPRTVSCSARWPAAPTASARSSQPPARERRGRGSGATRGRHRRAAGRDRR